MNGLERAQLGDMELLTTFSGKTTLDTISDMNYMRYVLPHEDVEEILSVIAQGVKPE